MPKLTARLRTVRRTIGSTQLGFLTMSSKVFFGEKKTPMIRPNELIERACASEPGTGVVAIEDSSTTRFPKSAFSRKDYARAPGNISGGWDCSAIGKMLSVFSNPLYPVLRKMNG